MAIRSLLPLLFLLPLPLHAAERRLDPERSTITIRVGKSGMLSAFGDTHEVRAPLASGTADDGPELRVEAAFDAAKLTVLDPGLAPDKRAEVQRRMLGPDVLDAARYPEIRFRSTKVTPEGPGHWRVDGTLTLHGKSAPLSFEMREEKGALHGSVSFRQTAFGITPVRVAAGTVRVKDEVTADLVVAVTGAAPAGPPAR